MTFWRVGFLYAYLPQIAIASHKSLDGFALGAELVRAGSAVSRSRYLILIVAFSCATPVVSLSLSLSLPLFQ
jgi:zinc transporter ZupT